ncbi:hypothetical protein [Janthinobacterium agaricidamnosum]|uniref:Uncharacterized protein n=1 Tax=Janthinobacterium agaricidamnosum NBRC 102515 = DSM 9628 TaxID=1349767 RepID=W0V3G1_9BURK|nr:hypothetical protein [Janthinobacterium agaricidamnosum]CDG82406.1 hypothetical protein GJA_1770 [Janthinobacterium agaricidamnosum NBRC 102515 = DSM 9628]
MSFPFERAEPEYFEKTVEWLYVKNYLDLSLTIAAPLAGTKEAAGDVLLSFEQATSWCLIEFKRDRGCFSAEREKYPVFGAEKWFKKIDYAQKKAGYISSYNHLIDSFVNQDGDQPHIFVYGQVRYTSRAQGLPGLLAFAKSATGLVRQNGASALVPLMNRQIKTLFKKRQTKAQVSRLNRPYIALRAETYWNDEWPNFKLPNGLSKATAVAKDIDMLMIGKTHTAAQPAFDAYLTALVLAKGSDPQSGGLEYSMVMALNDTGATGVMTFRDYLKYRSMVFDFPEEKELQIGASITRSQSPKR